MGHLNRIEEQRTSGRSRKGLRIDHTRMEVKAKKRTTHVKNEHTCTTRKRAELSPGNDRHMIQEFDQPYQCNVIGAAHGEDVLRGTLPLYISVTMEP